MSRISACRYKNGANRICSSGSLVLLDDFTSAVCEAEAHLRYKRQRHVYGELLTYVTALTKFEHSTVRSKDGKARLHKMISNTFLVLFLGNWAFPVELFGESTLAIYFAMKQTGFPPSRASSFSYCCLSDWPKTVWLRFVLRTCLPVRKNILIILNILSINVSSVITVSHFHSQLETLLIATSSTADSPRPRSAPLSWCTGILQGILNGAPEEGLQDNNWVSRQMYNLSTYNSSRKTLREFMPRSRLIRSVVCNYSIGTVSSFKSSGKDLTDQKTSLERNKPCSQDTSLRHNAFPSLFVRILRSPFRQEMRLPLSVHVTDWTKKCFLFTPTLSKFSMNNIQICF